MRKNTILAIIVSVVVLAGIVWWLFAANRINNSPGPNANSNITDLTNQSNVEVTISDMSFKPNAIKIKKGTKVTWTNQDTVAHSVVADDPANSSDFKAGAPTFSKGQKYSITFNTTGYFYYHCSVHSFMKGSVQVVD